MSGIGGLPNRRPKGGPFVRLKKSWTKPVIRRLDASSNLTPEQRQALDLLQQKARKAAAADG